MWTEEVVGYNNNASVYQLVDSQFPKLKAAGSCPVTCSKMMFTNIIGTLLSTSIQGDGAMVSAEVLYT